MVETSMNFHQGSREPLKMVGNLEKSGYYPGASSGRASGMGDSNYIHIQTI
jgi:hypothetical protein